MKFIKNDPKHEERNGGQQVSTVPVLNNELGIGTRVDL